VSSRQADAGRRALGLWLRVGVGTALAGTLLLVLSPPGPPARIPGVSACALGLGCGLVLYLLVSRQPPVLLPRAPLTLALARTGFLGLAALNEEVMWRWVLLGELLRVSAPAALAGSALAFGLAHRSRPGLHLGTGIGFGGVYLATGALAASVAAHWTYNVLLVSLSDHRRSASRRPP
jgi:membrane protease YdiL (CAAX protease family)